MSKPSREWIFWALLGASITAWIVFHFSALMACMGTCYVDLGGIHGYPVGYLELDDTRLNTWILAWTQHALVTPGASLFDANALYPAASALAGSEHLLGQALITLPLRALTDNAVLIYGVALMASYAILALSTALCVRWLLGSSSPLSRGIAIVAAIVAMAMPWRAAELSHLQLLWACWFPLIFGLGLRLLLREGSWRDSAALTVVLTLQLLSSYYLAYMITFGLGITALVVIALNGIDRPTLARLSAPALIPYGILGLVSIPYLSRAARGEIVVTLDPEKPMAGNHLGNAIEMLMPRLDTLWQQNAGFEIAFFIPASVLVLALVSFGWLRGGAVPPADKTRRRAACLALWIACFFSFLMTLGSHISLGENTFKLPAYWAAQFLPGFSSLRAPHRWAIVIGTLMPVLAALGAAWLLEKRVDGATRSGAGRSLGMAVVVALLVAINLPWNRLPALRASEENVARDSLYQKLGELPFGPVLELPWHIDSLTRNPADSSYMVASTEHWRPLLNGFTAHLPPSFFLLNRIAQGLPGASAVKRLGNLTDLRWIVVHWKELGPGNRQAWQGPRPGGLRAVYRNREGAIFELPKRPSSGDWMQALLDDSPRPLTLGGLSREALADPPAGGGILSLKTGPPFRYMGVQPLFRPLELEIRNPGSATWPGLDVQSEGLVQLRYAFSDLEDRLIETGNAPLDADLPPGVSTVSPVIGAPTRSGRYRLCAELVQIRAGLPKSLPFEPIEVEVEVSGIAENRGDALERLAIAYHEYRRESPEEKQSRCARERSAAPRR